MNTPAGGGDAGQVEQSGQQGAPGGAAGGADDSAAAAGTNDIGEAELNLLGMAGIDKAAIDEAIANMGPDKGRAWLGRVIESQVKALGTLGLPDDNTGGQRNQQQRQPVQQDQRQNPNANRTQQGQQAVGQQQAADPFADTTLKAMRELHGDEIVDQVIAPMKARFDALTQQIEQMQQVHQSQALQQGMDGFQSSLAPLLNSDALKLKYGAAWDMGNQSQVAARQQLADRAYAIAQHYQGQGRRITSGEALKLAFSVDNMQARQQAAAAVVRGEVKKAAGRTTIPPSAARSTGAYPKDDPFAAARAEIDKHLGVKKA